MIFMKIFIISAMFIVVISSTAALNYLITRNSTNKLGNRVVESIDKFNISECSGSDDICTKFGGQKLEGRCHCVCSQDKSTFGFYNNHWGCTENSIVRQHAACRYVLERSGSKGDHDPLFTLPVLGSHNDNNYVMNIPVIKSCKVIAANATFLECNGTWGKLTESNVKRKLSFQDHNPGALYVGPMFIIKSLAVEKLSRLMILQSGSPADPSLDGRVIRIPIQCEGLTWNPSQCVTFKIKGQLTCSSRNIPPIDTDEPTKIPTSSIPTSGIKIRQSDDDDPTPAAALIAGSVVGAVIFIIFIVVIITLAICLRREKAKANEKISEEREDAERTEASAEHQVNDFVIEPYAQFSGEGIQPNVIDNHSATAIARDVEPYYLSLIEPTATSQENRETRTDRETAPDYQKPRVEMRTFQDDRKRRPDEENEPDYQYPRADIRMDESGAETEPHYQYPKIGTVTRQDPNQVSRPDANRNDSPYEIMNPLYQNIGKRKEFEPPYVNIC